MEDEKMYFVLSCIIIPLILVIYYELNRVQREKSYQLAKSIWYFYSALFLIFNYFGEKSIINEHLTGFAIALALLEGTPGFWKLTEMKIKVLFGLK